MNKEFCLEDKRKNSNEILEYDVVLLDKDVKEFIRRLRLELCDGIKHSEAYVRLTISKLAGEKLL